jgi:hypothetical protein
MLLPHHENADQYYNVNVTNRSCENVSQFKYLGITLTNQNLIQKEIKRRPNSSIACYHSSRTRCLLICCQKRKHCMYKKNGVFWDVTLSGSCKNRRFGGT